MNPPEIALYVPDWRDAADPSVRNVGVPFWELPVLPRSWEPVLAAMDVVMAPSRFVQSACAGVVAAERVVHYPQAAFLPDGIRGAREAWGLASRRTVFALAFDFRSDIDRKNPWAAVEAFQAAFPRDETVALVVKTTRADDPVFAGRAEELRARIGSDPRIRLVDQVLAYPDVLALYASCDVLLSLHRSEGLGLHLMEAMSLGRVVVATNWSGNAEFMTPDNSIPVGYRLVPLQTTHPTYRREMGRAGQAWAEADLRDAVEALRRLHADPGRRAAIGLAAERDMKARREEVLSGGAFDAVERALAGAPRRGPALSRAVLRTLAGIFSREALRKVGSLARAAMPGRGAA
jgi:glycosyltransferase involved in cell wall biosynthesis